MVSAQHPDCGHTDGPVVGGILKVGENKVILWMLYLGLEVKLTCVKKILVLLKRKSWRNVGDSLVPSTAGCGGERA